MFAKKTKYRVDVHVVVESIEQIPNAYVNGAQTQQTRPKGRIRIKLHPLFLISDSLPLFGVLQQGVEYESLTKRARMRPTKARLD